VTKKRPGPKPREEIDPATLQGWLERIAANQVEPSTPRPTVRDTAKKVLGLGPDKSMSDADRRLLDRVIDEYEEHRHQIEGQARERRPTAVRPVMRRVEAPANVTNTRLVIGKCPHCGAPGVYQSDVSIQNGWPGCWVPKGDARDHQPVGAVCPNCGAPRSLGN
jgi:hypothetical protein